MGDGGSRPAWTHGRSSWQERVHHGRQASPIFRNLARVRESFGIEFTVIFTPDAVEPVTAIENLALAVVDMNLHNGIENSLDSKLDAALEALNDATANNDGAACNTLQAFINAVEAQRGNKLTEAQADQLIAAAQEIQDLLLAL